MLGWVNKWNKNRVPSGTYVPLHWEVQTRFSKVGKLSFYQARSYEVAGCVSALTDKQVLNLDPLQSNKFSITESLGSECPRCPTADKTHVGAEHPMTTVYFISRHAYTFCAFGGAAVRARGVSAKWQTLNLGF